MRHDITLTIVLGIGVVFILFLLMKRWKIRTSFIVLMAYFAGSSFIMIVFGLAGRSFPIQAMSSVYTDPEETVAVQLVRGSENNGTSNGITHIIPHYQLVAINVHTGEKQWTQSFASRETLIGPFMDGLLIHHSDGEVGTLSLLHMKTGKEKLSKKDFAQQYKQVVELISSSAGRMAVLDKVLYFEGIDGVYYQFDGKQLHEKPEAQEYLSTKFFVESTIPNYFASHDRPVDDEEYEKISEFKDDVLREPAIQPVANLEPQIMDVDLNQNTALVSYLKTIQKNAEQFVLFYDMKEHRMIWKANIGRVNSEQNHPGVRVLAQSLAIQTGDEFILLDKATGNEISRYELRWNRPIR